MAKIYERRPDPPPVECPRCSGLADWEGLVYICIDGGCRFSPSDKEWERIWKGKTRRWWDSRDYHFR